MVHQIQQEQTGLRAKDDSQSEADQTESSGGAWACPGELVVQRRHESFDNRNGGLGEGEHVEPDDSESDEELGELGIPERDESGRLACGELDGRAHVTLSKIATAMVRLFAADIAALTDR